MNDNFWIQCPEIGLLIYDSKRDINNTYLWRYFLQLLQHRKEFSFQIVQLRTSFLGPGYNSKNVVESVEIILHLFNDAISQSLMGKQRI